MDTNEIIALLIVAIAASLVVRYFCKRKGRSCCGTDCFALLNKKDTDKKKSK